MLPVDTAISAMCIRTTAIALFCALTIARQPIGCCALHLRPGGFVWRLGCWLRGACNIPIALLVRRPFVCVCGGAVHQSLVGSLVGLAQVFAQGMVLSPAGQTTLPGCQSADTESCRIRGKIHCAVSFRQCSRNKEEDKWQHLQLISASFMHNEACHRQAAHATPSRLWSAPVDAVQGSEDRGGRLPLIFRQQQAQSPPHLSPGCWQMHLALHADFGLIAWLFCEQVHCSAYKNISGHFDTASAKPCKPSAAADASRGLACAPAAISSNIGAG